MYINTETLTQHSEQEIRALYPNTSFPALFVPPEGYALVFSTPQPTHNPVTQRVQQITPELTVLDTWEQRWVIVELFETQEERDALIAADIATKQAAAVATIVKLITDSTQKRLDSFFQTRGYDGVLSACTYATSAIPKFAAEGQYAVNARDLTWATLYTFMGEVQLGNVPMPADFADVEPLLPALAWPA